MAFELESVCAFHVLYAGIILVITGSESTVHAAKILRSVSTITMDFWRETFLFLVDCPWDLSKNGGL